MAESTQLSGKHLLLVFSGPQIVHHFVDGHALMWEVVRDGQNGNAEYRVFEVRPDIFFVNFYKLDYEKQVSLILNLSTGQAIAGIADFHN